MKPLPKKPLRPTMNQDNIQAEPATFHQNESSIVSDYPKSGPFGKPTGLNNPFTKSTTTSDDHFQKPRTVDQDGKQASYDSAKDRSEMSTQKTNIIKGYTKSLTSQAHSKS